MREFESEGIVRLFAINSTLNLAESERNVIDRNQSIISQVCKMELHCFQLDATMGAYLQ
jgi:hypothetical protein